MWGLGSGNRGSTQSKRNLFFVFLSRAVRVFLLVWLASHVMRYVLSHEPAYEQARGGAISPTRVTPTATKQWSMFHAERRRDVAIRLTKLEWKYPSQLTHPSQRNRSFFDLSPPRTALASAARTASPRTRSGSSCCPSLA